MQTAHVSEGEPQAEDSNISHLSVESQAYEIFVRSGSAPVGPSLSPHARVRSAPPARPRFGDKTPSAEVPNVAWIPSIPGRIIHGSSPIPSLRIYSGTNSVSSSRGPSCKAKQPVPTDSGGEAKANPGHDHSATTNAQSSKTAEHSGVIRPCSALTNPRAKWKCDDQGWSKFSAGAHRCMLLTPTHATVGYNATFIDEPRLQCALKQHGFAQVSIVCAG